LRFQELSTQPPDELVEAGLPGLTSRGDDLLQEDDCTRHDPGGMGGPEPVALPVETDSRNWRARNPPPPLQAVVQQQQLQRTPNKQRNDKNERNERDRNENNSRGSKDQTNAQASLPLQQQPLQPPQNNPLSENRAVTTIAKAANPWSARRGAQSEKEKVFRTVKGILNKLTPEK
jgi:translation initiation factor 4G